MYRQFFADPYSIITSTERNIFDNSSLSQTASSQAQLRDGVFECIGNLSLIKPHGIRNLLEKRTMMPASSLPKREEILHGSQRKS